MRYRISQIKLNPRDVAKGNRMAILHSRVARECGKKVSISNLEIVRESVDARKKPDVKLVYTVDFDCDEMLPFEEAKADRYDLNEFLKERFGPLPDADISNISGPGPVVAGFGPCGIFAALVLAEAGLRPIVIERGKAAPERIADVEVFWKSEGNMAPDPESNVQFGEGGAGTFSDGKLTTGIKDLRIGKVLRDFVDAGADPEILYRQKPHIGTDRLRDVVVNLRKRIISLGGEVRFSTRLEGLVTEKGRLTGVRVRGPEGTEETLETGALIMAIGHSARDTFRMLYEAGFAMEQKPFSIGMRIRHPQEMINRAQYGDPALAGILGPADYKLSYRCGDDSDTPGRGVYTFCMCPGGEVVNASTEPETSVTNGMSNSARDGRWANSALLVDVRTEDYSGCHPSGEKDHPLAGLEFQKKYERLAWQNRTKNGMAESTYGAFRDNAGDPVRNSLPDFAVSAVLEAMPNLGRKLKGFDSPDSVLTAVETRSSSPVRILRNGEMQAQTCSGTLNGVIPAGEGPGYAGGIMSAAVDGIRAAEGAIWYMLNIQAGV